MPSKGFKVASIREDAYAEASRIADDEHKSIGDIVSQAVMDYSATRRQLISKMQMLLKAIDAQGV